MKNEKILGNCNKLKKGVNTMRGVIVGLTVLLVLFAAGNGFCQQTNNATVSSTKDLVIFESYANNAAGVQVSGTRRTVTTLTSVNDQGQRQVTLSDQTTTLRSLGGSGLKPVSVALSSDTNADDGSSSHTTGSTTYSYNGNGQLFDASGSADTTGNRGRDNNGQQIGTYTAHSTDSYAIQNGEALNNRSVTTGTNNGPDGASTSTFTETKTTQYQMIHGSYHTTSTTSNNATTGTDGSGSNITKTYTYQRDANGVATGMTPTQTGTQTIRDDQGGLINLTMQNYQGSAAYDPTFGYYINNESWQWRQQSA